MASVQNLFRSPKKHFPMEELQEARVLADFGFEACAHAQPGGSRQALLGDRETVEALELQPGVLFENITTGGVNVNRFATAEQLRLGEALLEVSAACPRGDQ